MHCPGRRGHGHYVSVFILQGVDRELLRPSIALLQAAADDGHYGVREERASAIPAMLSALPGHSGINPRSVVLRAQAMADLVPVRSIWRGHAACPSSRLPAGAPALMQARARMGEHVHVNLLHGDLGHKLLFGPTGAGKSVLLGRAAVPVDAFVFSVTAPRKNRRRGLLGRLREPIFRRNGKIRDSGPEIEVPVNLDRWIWEVLPHVSESGEGSQFAWLIGSIG